MPHAGQELHGPDGMRLLLVATADETDGAVLEMEASYSGTAPMPPLHLHPRQAERFTILDGRVRAIVGGVERVHEAGATFEVPAGTPHQMAAEGPARMRWEVRPALRTAEFFERLYAGPGDGDPAAFGLALLRDFADEIRFAGA